MPNVGFDPRCLFENRRYGGARESGANWVRFVKRLQRLPLVPAQNDRDSRSAVSSRRCEVPKFLVGKRHHVIPDVSQSPRGFLALVVAPKYVAGHESGQRDIAAAPRGVVCCASCIRSIPTKTAVFVEFVSSRARHLSRSGRCQIGMPVRIDVDLARGADRGERAARILVPDPLNQYDVLVRLGACAAGQ